MLGDAPTISALASRLVGIDALDVGAPGEGNCCVLVVTFAIAQDGIPGQTLPCTNGNYKPTVTQTLVAGPTLESRSCTLAPADQSHPLGNWHQ